MNGILPVKIVKVLGEGGFSFVYLAQDEASGVSASSSGNYFMGHSH
jgi:serine/threonine protein kinase